jgi:hypothetical protein
MTLGSGGECGNFYAPPSQLAFKRAFTILFYYKRTKKLKKLNPLKFLLENYEMDTFHDKHFLLK